MVVVVGVCVHGVVRLGSGGAAGHAGGNGGRLSQLPPTPPHLPPCCLHPCQRESVIPSPSPSLWATARHTQRVFRCYRVVAKLCQFFTLQIFFALLFF